jgi:acylphosphatase
MDRIRFVVEGRVQGVGFRAHAQREARRLGLTGFVQNRADGAVDGEAQGSGPALVVFRRWLRQGPPWGRVDHVDTAPAPVRDDEQGFAVRW